MKRFSFLRRVQRRDLTAAEFEAAVNKVISADTIADVTRQPYITEEGALNLTAVWACVRILSETVGTLPMHLYRRTAKGRERQYGHPCHQLVQRPNSYSTRFDLMHHLMVSCALWGNGYARIYRDKRYRPTRLKLLHPARIEPILTDNDEPSTGWTPENCSPTSTSSTCGDSRPMATKARVPSPFIGIISNSPSRHNSTANASSIRAAICRVCSSTPPPSSPKLTSGLRKTCLPNRSVCTMPMSRSYWKAA